MAKKLDFDKEKNNRNDNAIEEIMQAEFPLPKQAEDAKNEAFSRIREMAAASGNVENTENMVQRLREKSTEKSTGSSGKKSSGTAKSHKKFKAVYKTALGLTAAAAVFSAVCITNPAFAENIPLVGNVFKQLGNSLGFYGDYSKYAKQLTDSTEDALSADADGSQEGSSNSQNVQVEDQNTTENHNADKTKDDQSYSKTVDGTTVTLSEVYCNELAMYLSMAIHTEDKFPDTFITSDGKPNIKLSEDSTVKYDYMDGKSNLFNAYLDGKMLDDNTYACIFRYDLAEAAKDYTEYNEKYNEMTQQVMDEMGITQADLDDQTDEGYALLEEFINKLSERGGEYQKYIKDIDIPDTFNLHLDITKVRGLEANYQWSEEDEKKYGRDAGYYKYEGDWSFDIPVTVDDSQTEVLELNDTNDAGIGLKSVIRTPYELTVNELYKEGSNSDCFMVALDANGNTLPYNESTGNCNNFAIQDRDISTVDIYFLDYVQYMDELKGQQNFDNPTKEDGQKWKKLLEENAKYHKTLHFDNDNVKN